MAEATASRARYTEQTVTLTDRPTKVRIREQEKRFGVSMAAIMRQVCHEGLPALEAWAEGDPPLKYLDK